MIAIDTNILVYAVDDAEPEKCHRADELLESLLQSGTAPVLLWQVAVEFLACLRRWESGKRINRAQTERYLDRIIRSLPVTFPSPECLSLSLRLSSKHSLSHWDSMLLAACTEAGVVVLYSEDFTDGATYGAVKVINPFSGG